MKYILLILSTISFTTTAQTTIEEYNYLTKGYKYQIENGLDMKKGYRLIKFGEFLIPKIDYANRIGYISGLYKDSTNCPKGILIEYLNLNLNQKSYICIPVNTNDKYVWNKFFEEIGNLGFEARQAVIYLISQIPSINICEGK